MGKISIFRTRGEIVSRLVNYRTFAAPYWESLAKEKFILPGVAYLHEARTFYAKLCKLVGFGYEFGAGFLVMKLIPQIRYSHTQICNCLFFNWKLGMLFRIWYSEIIGY